MHDIICMANNLSNHEAYLIIGISDDPVEIKGIKKYSGRWKQENYLDFITILYKEIFSRGRFL